jgi:hypothetical protein
MFIKILQFIWTITVPLSFILYGLTSFNLNMFMNIAVGNPYIRSKSVYKSHNPLHNDNLCNFNNNECLYTYVCDCWHVLDYVNNDIYIYVVDEEKKTIAEAEIEMYINDHQFEWFNRGFTNGILFPYLIHDFFYRSYNRTHIYYQLQFAKWKLSKNILSDPKITNISPLRLI